MPLLKRLLKRNSHNIVLKVFAGLGRSVNRLYENRNHDLHSNGELNVIKKISSTKPSIIFDGGANNGEYSALFAQYSPETKIYSFEPVDTTFDLLVKNTEDFENVIPFKKGLYKENCTKEINIFNAHTHSSIFDIQGLHYDATSKVSIDLIKGDDFVREHAIEQIDFLKIDIEGAEYDALLGFEETIKQGKIKAVQFEYGYINITTKKLLIDFYAFLEKYGYVLGKIFPKKVEFRKYEYKYEDFLGPNFIAIKKSEESLIKLLS